MVTESEPSLADAFQFADDVGPAKVLFMLEPALGLRAIPVVDNVAAGPAIGGVRMAGDVSLEERVRLARSNAAPVLEGALRGKIRPRHAAPGRDEPGSAAGAQGDALSALAVTGWLRVVRAW